MNRYYLTQRPPMPGAFPGKPEIVKSFDYREYVEEIGRQAWGFVEYKEPLSKKDAADYELVPPTEQKGERTKTLLLKTLLLNALDIIIEHEAGDTSRYESRQDFWRWLFDCLGTDLEELERLGIDLSDYDNEIEHYFEEEYDNEKGLS